MEVKMPYVKRMGLGGIMLEVIMVGCFWLLLADFKIGMVNGNNRYCKRYNDVSD